MVAPMEHFKLSKSNVFPYSQLFARLVAWTCRRPQSIAIRDDILGLEVTYTQLLADVLATRQRLEKILDSETRIALQNQEDVYIVILALGGIEFAVAVLAVLALGAAVVPITPKQPVEEALYYVKKSKAAAILASLSSFGLGQSLQEAAWSAGLPKSFLCLNIRESIFSSPVPSSDTIVSHDWRLNNNGAALVIFTSGTTGPPKGVVQRRFLLDDGSLYSAQQMDVTENDTILHVLPVHHATGFQLSFFPFLLSGACIEFYSGSFNAHWIWERLKRGGITFFSGVPTMYSRMMRHFRECLAQKADVREYVEGARRVRNICGTSVLPHSVDSFWTNLLGQRIVQRYGSTETAVVFSMPMGTASRDVPDGSVGEKAWGVDVKLTTEGEVLVKNVYQFSRYLNDTEATAQAFTKDGYFKTGDVARKEGNYYWIMGRASVDILKSGGYKISALDVEREILALPYISEAMVVGVEDEEFGQRVAAVVSLRMKHGPADHAWRATHSGSEYDLTLSALRRDLSSRLAGYKRPTLLRVIKNDLPRTASGKVIKKSLTNLYFPQNYDSIPDVQIWKPPISTQVNAKL